MDYSEYIIKNYNNWILYLQPNQFYLGRCYLWYAYDNPVDLFELDQNSLKELADITCEVKRALSKCFMPDMFNYASLNNITRHLHFHVIPRYQRKVIFENFTFEDKNWGKNYSPYPNDFLLPPDIIKLIITKINSELN